MYYRSTNTGRIVTDTDIRAVSNIYGLTKEKLLVAGTIEPVDHPTVVDCLRHGGKVVAILRYREIHGCSLKSARDSVDLIEMDMKRFQKIARKNRNRKENEK